MNAATRLSNKPNLLVTIDRHVQGVVVGKRQAHGRDER